MSRIRLFHPGDERALARVCLLTADAGADATGQLDDDELWAQVYLLPYLRRHPEFAFVLEDDDGSPVGYAVGAPDTDAFEQWFRARWWPPVAARRPPAAETASVQDGLLQYACARGSRPDPYQQQGFAAHLHIDLLPPAQGQGWGRRLIQTLTDALRADGVDGVHLVASARNTAAASFYRRLGFQPLPSPKGALAFGMVLRSG